jgi:hypothetical protein
MLLIYTVSSPGLSVSDILYMCDITVDDLGFEIKNKLSFVVFSNVRISRQNLNSSNFSRNAILFHNGSRKTKMNEWWMNFYYYQFQFSRASAYLVIGQNLSTMTRADTR